MSLVHCGGWLGNICWKIFQLGTLNLSPVNDHGSTGVGAVTDIVAHDRDGGCGEAAGEGAGSA